MDPLVATAPAPQRLLFSMLVVLAVPLLFTLPAAASRLPFREAETTSDAGYTDLKMAAASETLAGHLDAAILVVQELNVQPLAGHAARKLAVQDGANSRPSHKDGAGGGDNVHASIDHFRDQSGQHSIPDEVQDSSHEVAAKLAEVMHSTNTANVGPKDGPLHEANDEQQKPRHHVRSSSSSSSSGRTHARNKSTGSKQITAVDKEDGSHHDKGDAAQQEHIAHAASAHPHGTAVGLAARLAKAKVALQAAKAARDARTAIGEDAAVAAVVAAASAAEALADDGEEGTANGFLVGTSDASHASLTSSAARSRSSKVTANNDADSSNGVKEEASAVGVAAVAADPYAQDSLPVVLWHGMGDSCCATWSIGAVADTIRQKLGVYVHSIATGLGPTHDILSSYFGDVNDQVAAVCKELRTIPELKNGFNAVGFSQGGQFMRAVVQRCQHTLSGPGVVNLITLGAQHQGIMNIPGCAAVSTNSSFVTCKVMQRLLAQGAYLPYVRDHVVQAQYFKDPNRLDQYLASNPFLPDINNEHPSKSAIYKDNLAKLHSLILYRFKEDDTVVPRDSAWFYFYDGQQLRTLKELDLYTEDWIGLRVLDESNRLIFAEAPGAHMQFTLQWFEDEIIDKYLAGPPPSSSLSSSGNILTVA